MVDTLPYCTHGLVQQNKFGLEDLPGGGQACKGCGLPTVETYRLPRFVEARRTQAEAAAADRPRIVTTNDMPLHTITAVHGDVFGLVVMSRDYFSNLGARFRTIVGGEVGGYTELLTRSRNEARGRLWDSARALGANAVIAFRFDCNEIGQIMSEVAAYGTAVTVERLEASVPG